MKLFHAWFSQAAALRHGSAIYRKADGSHVNVTRMNSESMETVGPFRHDEKYVGDVMGGDDGGGVTVLTRVRGITE
jgi:hypothetical protein